MKGTAYLIPGYCESYRTHRGYAEIGSYFESHGIRVVHVEIPWRTHTPENFEQYVRYFKKHYRKARSGNTYVLGFSFGAVIAALSSPELQPDRLILCSLSPYFKEDLVRIRPAWVRWFRKHFKDSDHSFDTLAQQISSKTYIVVGDKEGVECERRARDAHTKILGSTLCIAKGAEHTIRQKPYQDALQKVVENMMQDTRTIGQNILPHQSGLTVQKSRSGLGIFTERAFARGETLFRVEGPFVRCDIDDDMDAIARDNTFRYDMDRYISPAGTIGDYLNHSCEPNARIVKQRGRLHVQAVKRIPKGTEVTIDYSTITAMDDAWVMPGRCRCGTPTCRTTIRSFDSLPVKLQKKYIRMEIVPTYILAINRTNGSTDTTV